MAPALTNTEEMGVDTVPKGSEQHTGCNERSLWFLKVKVKPCSTGKDSSKDQGFRWLIVRLLKTLKKKIIINTVL